ncbi:MAG: hypothetical protein AAF196_06815 [Planctomycetota bacterium]
MRRLKFIVLVLAAIVLLIIALQNTESVTTEVLWAEVETSRALLLIVCLGFGYVFGVAHVLLRTRRAKKKGDSSRKIAA